MHPDHLSDFALSWKNNEQQEIVRVAWNGEIHISGLDPKTLKLAIAYLCRLVFRDMEPAFKENMRRTSSELINGNN